MKGKLWINKDVDVVLFEQEPQFKEKKSVLIIFFFMIIRSSMPLKNMKPPVKRMILKKLRASLIKMDELGAWDFDAKVKQILAN